MSGSMICRQSDADDANVYMIRANNVIENTVKLDGPTGNHIDCSHATYSIHKMDRLRDRPLCVFICAAVMSRNDDVVRVAIRVRGIGGERVQTQEESVM